MFRAGLQVQVVHGSTRFGGDEVTLDEMVAFIDDKRNKQADVAREYAVLLRTDENEPVVDWPRINIAIVDRWSMFGLYKVKRLAWEQYQTPWQRASQKR
jgi:hypothetical protein